MRASLATSVMLMTFLPLVVTNSLSCDYDSPANSAEFDGCLKLGERFIKRYTNKLKRGRNGRCSLFAEFRSCVSTILTRCPSMQRAFPPEWLLIHQMYNCACNETAPESKNCQKDLSCFETQYGGVLARRCDAFYKFNIHQGTLKKCHFVTENVWCKEALVTSACGARAGQLAFHVAKMTFKRADRCHIQKEQNYTGFHYTEQCPTDFVAKMQKCEEDHFDETKLVFFMENDLIAVGGSRNVQLACRGYRAYKSCVQPLEDNCPSGTNLLYEFNSELRAYLLKMEYICITDKESYADHIVCYQDIHYNQTLQECNHIFQSLIPVLNRLTAFEFYCQPNHTSSQKALGFLTDLNSCYENVFTAGCGANGSRAMVGLMSDAFRDPYYLRYKFQPNCKLHGIEDPAVPAEPLQDSEYKNPSKKSTDDKSRHHHHDHKKKEDVETSPVTSSASLMLPSLRCGRQLPPGGNFLTLTLVALFNHFFTFSLGFD